MLDLLRIRDPDGISLPARPGEFGVGDSGGPHFLGGMESNLIVSLTVTGDSMCRATDLTYRLDTASAQEFLSRFGLVPARRERVHSEGGPYRPSAAGPFLVATPSDPSARDLRRVNEGPAAAGPSGR